MAGNKRPNRTKKPTSKRKPSGNKPGRFKKFTKPQLAELYKMEEIKAGKRMVAGIEGRKAEVKRKKIPFGKKPVDRKIRIISRVGQPRPWHQVQPIERKSYLASVSSTWLANIGYLYGTRTGTFTTKTGRQYKIQEFDFNTFEEWYYAHSKGTFWNERIRDHYTIVRLF